ncbi:zeta toxin family protein [Sessilibacter corallicola]|uniref:zeta toxin family protein n=1 Tax=Sessilibacter corallicola TaxID=2904075 RepID=UPI001E320058|nr:zeta toxin family protein [Sessilibacter corallicola]MCE2028010.1 zeta toxin family protein [Sessilibacter corallicola]
MSEPKPKMILIAGPNGSGKTTLTEKLKSAGVDLGEYVNPDDIALTLEGSGDEVVRKAQKIAENKRQELLNSGIAHSFESVMSHHSKIEYMIAAKEKDFYVILFFVGINDPSINVERVTNRVAKGGHDVPTEKIRSRYKRTMNMLYEAAITADEAVIFDNTQRSEGLKKAAVVKKGQLKSFDPRFPWVRKYLVTKFDSGF